MLISFFGGISFFFVQMTVACYIYCEWNDEFGKKKILTFYESEGAVRKLGNGGGLIMRHAPYKKSFLYLKSLLHGGGRMGLKSSFLLLRNLRTAPTVLLRYLATVFPRIKKPVLLFKF